MAAVVAESTPQKGTVFLLASANSSKSTTATMLSRPAIIAAGLLVLQLCSKPMTVTATPPREWLEPHFERPQITAINGEDRLGTPDWLRYYERIQQVPFSGYHSSASPAERHLGRSESEGLMTQAPTPRALPADAVDPHALKVALADLLAHKGRKLAAAQLARTKQALYAPPPVSAATSRGHSSQGSSFSRIYSP